MLIAISSHPIPRGRLDDETPKPAAGDRPTCIPCPPNVGLFSGWGIRIRF
jgi:hypothetical protein